MQTLSESAFRQTFIDKPACAVRACPASEPPAVLDHPHAPQAAMPCLPKHDPGIALQGYYDEDMDSEMTESQVDEEVAVTKRGRAVKMPAKYKAEVSLCSTGFPGKTPLWYLI